MCDWRVVSYAGALVLLATLVCETDVLAADKSAADKASATTSLFDGKTLAGWKKSVFGGEGDVEVKDGTIVMQAGSPMTGITWTGKYPKMNYEISLQAKRVDGSDFFCGLTFPVGESPCSFIVGGWGGGVIGLSNLNGFDALGKRDDRLSGVRERPLVQHSRAGHRAQDRSLDR